MFNTIRKHQRWLMVLIAVLTIIAFAFLYDRTDFGGVGTNVIARIYGRDVLAADVERVVRSYQLALILGQYGLVQDLGGRARTEDEAVSNFVWNLMVLRHEAKALQVEPDDKAVENAIKQLPLFQTDRQFDPAKYSEFTQQQLAPRGLTPRQLEGVIRDALRLEAVRALVETPAMLVPDDIEPAMEQIRPMDLEVVRFTLPAVEEAVSDDLLREAYEQRKEALQQPETRTLQYVLFGLTPEEAQQDARERVAAQQRVANAASDFAQALADSGRSFGEVAAERQLAVRTTPPVQPDGTAVGMVEDGVQDVIEAAAPVAFRLEPEDSFDIVQVGDGYAVVSVASVEPARPLTFDEAVGPLRAEFTQRAREQAVAERAQAAVAAIRAAMKDGRTFRQAAEEQGLTVTSYSGVSLFSRELPPGERQVAIAAVDLPVGGVSDFQPARDGGFVVSLAGRQPLDEAQVAAQQQMIEQSLLQGKRQIFFVQWLHDAREAAGLQVLRTM